MPVYSDNLETTGEEFMKSWVTFSENLNLLISKIGDKEFVTKVLDTLKDGINKIVIEGQYIIVILDTISSMSAIVMGVKPLEKNELQSLPDKAANFLNAIEKYKLASQQILTSLEKLREHFNVMAYSSETLIQMTEVHLSQLG
jgi:hypothetical protein